MPDSQVPSSPGGGSERIAIPIASEKPNSSAPPNAPIGVHRPKITAARAMNPRLAVIPFWNEAFASSVSQAPARPAKIPPRMTLR